MRIRFRDFVLDPGRRELQRDSRTIHLTPKVLQLLQLLVERRPRAVSQAELQDLLWPDTFVEKANLHNLVHQLRVALDDDGTIICTSYGYGFSFGVPATDDQPRPAHWKIVVAGREFDLSEGENVVGREIDSAVKINESSVSRHHARLLVSSDGVRVEDLGSKNGTFVGGHRVRATGVLRDGVYITFGDVVARLQLVAAPSTETMK